MKALYRRLAGRERLLLGVFLTLAGLLWTWGAAARGARRWDNFKGYRADRAAQDLWLGRRAQVAADAAQVARQLQPERTLDPTGLFAEVNQLARGLAYEVGGQRSEQSGRVAVHYVQLNVRKAEMAALLRLHDALQERSPYLGIEHCELAVERAEPGRINATFRIYALQVLAPAAVKI